MHSGMRLDEICGLRTEDVCLKCVLNEPPITPPTNAPQHTESVYRLCAPADQMTG